MYATTLTLATLNSGSTISIFTNPFSYYKNKFLTWEVTHRI